MSQLVHPKYRPDVDGLRSVAVLSVVIFHAFPKYLIGGFVGVDVFFVISGYLISSIIFSSVKKGVFSYSDFYSRRIKRIFPALMLMLSSVVVFGWFALLGDEYRQLGKHVFGGAGFLANIVLWSEAGYFDTTAATKPLLHLWSLGVEEQFYFLWPLLVAFFVSLRVKLVYLVVGVIILSFGLNLYEVSFDRSSAFYLPFYRFWELLLGALLAAVTLELPKGAFSPRNQKLASLLRDLISILGLILILSACFLVSEADAFPGWLALLPVLGATMIISVGPDALVNKWVLSNKIAVWFGLISYPLYLWHWPLLSFARIIESSIPAKEIRILAVLLSVFLAWVTYKFIELPVRQKNWKKNDTKKLFFGMVFVCLSGAVIFYGDGFPSRATIKNFKDNRNELAQSKAVDDSCLSYIKEKEPAFPYCRFNELNDGEIVALIGDSHAHAAYSGMAKVLSEKNINTVSLANSACPPFVGAEYGATDTEKQACKNRISKILDIVANDPRIKKVVIFSRGPIYLTGKFFGDAEDHNLSFVPISSELFYSGLQDTINLLVSKGKKAFYVVENPEIPYSPSACISRPFRINPKTCVQDISTVMARQANYREIIVRLVNVDLIDSAEFFCGNGRCDAFNNGDLLYSDFDHLSPAGSFYQAKNIIEKMEFDDR